MTNARRPFPSPLWGGEGLPRQSSAKNRAAAGRVSILLSLCSLQSAGRRAGARSLRLSWSWADPGTGADQVAVTPHRAARQVSSIALHSDLYKSGEAREDLLAGCPVFPNSGSRGRSGEWWPAEDWSHVILPLRNTWEEGLRNECPSSEPGTTPQIFPSSQASDSSLRRWGAWTRWVGLLHGVICRVVGGFSCCGWLLQSGLVFPAHTLGELSVWLAHLGPE